MINLNFHNCHKINSTHGFAQSEFQTQSKNLPHFLKKIHARNQGFCNILDDKNVVKKINNYKQSIEGRFDDIVVLGIGGSALGTIAIRDALKKTFKQSPPHLHVLENIDPDVISELLTHVNLKKTLFLVISKSGGTAETLSQYLFFRNEIETSGSMAHKHFVFITGETGLLRKIADKDNIKTFNIPSNVGGRFSVLTNVGLIPSALIGIDIESLLSGAKEMRDAFLSEKFENNLPFQLATIQYLSHKKGKNINILMPYASRLKSFTAWFTQLLAESTGKINSSKENTGITPLSALGATDQHSLLQLLSEGPNDKLTIFLKVINFKKNSTIPVNIDHENVNFLKDVSFSQLLNTQQEGTATSLTENNRPNITIEIPEISEKTLGSLFFLFEGSTAFLGEYLEINSFDQPGVERSKVLTRESLLPGKSF